MVLWIICKFSSICVRFSMCLLRLLLLLVHCFNLVLDGSLDHLQVLLDLRSVLNVLAPASPPSCSLLQSGSRWFSGSSASSPRSAFGSQCACSGTPLQTAGSSRRPPVRCPTPSASPPRTGWLWSSSAQALLQN